LSGTAGLNPAEVMVNRRPRTELPMRQSNPAYEAEGMEWLGRNESESIELRNGR
jgi:hypothetical protein